MISVVEVIPASGPVVLVEVASSGVPGPAGSAGPAGATGPAGPGITEPPQDGRVYGRRNGVWVPVRTVVLQAEYTLNAATAAPPASGQVRLNHALMTNATTMWISGTSATSLDLSNFLGLIYPENAIHLQDKDNSDSWRAYNVNGAPVVSGGYVTVPILYVQGGTALPAGQRILLSVLGQHYIGVT